MTIPMDQRPFAGKLALVTGASGLLGSAIAERLAADGAAVLVHYHADSEGAERTLSAIAARGGKAAALQADLGLPGGPSALIDQINSAFGGIYAGRLDILVNNAGVFYAGELAEISDETFDWLFAVNVRAMFQLSREASVRMSAQKWGRIINVGSVFGERSFGPGLSLYSATKFAVKGFTQGWSRDLGPHGITVNSVQPALIQADIVPSSGPVLEAMQRYVSVGRFGKGDDVAGAVAFLASPASGYINGASLVVDGGWNA